MKDGKGWVWVGCLLGYFGGRLAMMINPIISLIVIIIALGITLYGCFLWTQWKNRHWAFMFWGLLAPIGLLGISLLKDKEDKKARAEFQERLRNT